MVPACVWIRDIGSGSALIKRLVLAAIDAHIRVGNQAVLYSASGISLGRLIKGLDQPDRKSTRLNSSHSQISYAVFCLKKKKNRKKYIVKNLVGNNTDSGIRK